MFRAETLSGINILYQSSAHAQLTDNFELKKKRDLKKQVVSGGDRRKIPKPKQRSAQNFNGLIM